MFISQCCLKMPGQKHVQTSNDSLTKEALPVISQGGLPLWAFYIQFLHPTMLFHTTEGPFPHFLEVKITQLWLSQSQNIPFQDSFHNTSYPTFLLYFLLLFCDPLDSSHKELPIFWIFPYFFESRIRQFFPSYCMLDYQVQ